MFYFTIPFCLLYRVILVKEVVIPCPKFEQPNEESTLLVNVLTHTTEVKTSTKEHNIIKKLQEKYEDRAMHRHVGGTCEALCHLRDSHLKHLVNIKS